MRLTVEEREWEALCRCCGRCCFEKGLDSRGRWRETAVACRYLDIQTRHCKVYAHRFEVGEDCVRLTPEVVAAADWLPADCAYVQYLHNHRELP